MAEISIDIAEIMDFSHRHSLGLESTHLTAGAGASERVTFVFITSEKLGGLLLSRSGQATGWEACFHSKGNYPTRGRWSGFGSLLPWREALACAFMPELFGPDKTIQIAHAKKLHNPLRVATVVALIKKDLREMEVGDVHRD